MKSEKKFEFFSSIFFVQEVAWDIQKCILKGFFKNINTILNAPYPYDLKLKLPAPFSHSEISGWGPDPGYQSPEWGLSPVPPK